VRRYLALGLLAGAAADQVFGDPRRGHPVAAFGRAAAIVEQIAYRDSKPAGMAFTAVCVGAPVVLGVAAERLCAGPVSRTAVVAAAAWTVIGGASLRREASMISEQLARADLPAARIQLTHLVGRDTSGLDGGEIARAAVESVAENTSDAVVAPLLWGAVAGVPGLLGYRAINTLDAMVGYRSARYGNFGWAAARLDDVANLLPARATAVLVSLAGGRPARTWRTARRDARRHPSPNAGWCEAAYAGALDVRLGGSNVYGGQVDERPFLGDGKPVQASDLARAVAIEGRVRVAGAIVAALLAWGRR
jgi:adenosylcobinamide-phosphate synthase